MQFGSGGSTARDEMKPFLRSGFFQNLFGAVQTAGLRVMGMHVFLIFLVILCLHSLSGCLQSIWSRVILSRRVVIT